LSLLGCVFCHGTALPGVPSQIQDFGAFAKKALPATNLPKIVLSAKTQAKMPHQTRRELIKAGLVLAAARPFGDLAHADPVATAAPLLLDASVPALPATGTDLHLGSGESPDGHEFGVDSVSLRRDGNRWVPVMGEMHFARYPAAEWRDELLKMKAGGISTISTYVFWIHHEEVEGTFDWVDRRSLRDFARTCKSVGLPLVVRFGPWCHGECRNGGFPDWLVKSGVHLRSDDPAYLAKVRTLYGEIAGQLKGQLWKDGGPVVGIQLENEFGGPAQHLLTLKSIARDAGVDVPLYTRTGWPNLRTPMPYGEMVPLFGAYAEGFWDRSLTAMPGSYGDAFRFSLAPGASAAAIGTDQLGAHAAGAAASTGRHPYCCCEIGGGMETSYHRRIWMRPADIEATALVKIGSGNNLQGYYMYHGGTNPEGRLTTLQESLASGYPNDMPVLSYDFQAPLGEFGQIREHYHALRRLHLFVADFGPDLAVMPARLPTLVPANSRDSGTLRWTVRTAGDVRGGFVFVNNYQRHQLMSAKPDVQFEIKLPSGSIRFPREPITVPSDSLFFWPFQRDLGGAKLAYATVQPICTLDDGGSTYFFFAETTGIPAEFVFESAGLTVEKTWGSVTKTGGQIRIGPIKSGTGDAIRLRTAGGKRIALVLLGPAQSLTCYKGDLKGRRHVFLTRAGLTLDGDDIRLRATDAADLELAVFPAPGALKSGSRELKATADGIFHRYALPFATVARPSVTFDAVQPAGPARIVSKAKSGVAAAPTDSDFDQAAVYRLKVADGGTRDLLLRIRYVGDAARLYLNGKLLTDNFYNGTPFEIGMKRYAPAIYHEELLLKVLPLRRDAPVYLQTEAMPEFNADGTALALHGIETIETHEARLTAA
jgi:beta-galactosidase